MDLRVLSVIEVTAILSLLLGGLGVILQIKTRSELNRIQRLRKWPTAHGIIFDSKLKKPISPLANFIQEVNYTYQVNEQKFESTGNNKTSFPAIKRIAWLPFRQKENQYIFHESPCGTPVIVYYNPANPKDAYIKTPSISLGNRIGRIGGKIFAALTLLLILNSVFMVMYNKDDLAYASSLPALIPNSASNIIASLESSLGLACKPEDPDVYGPAIGYQVSVCESPVNPNSPIVWIFSRKNVPDKVDYLQVSPGITQGGVDWKSLGKVASLTGQVSEVQFISDWVTLIAPRLLVRGGETKLSIGRVNYQMYADGNAPQSKVKLEIGTKQ
jgi:hypothetical protein